MWTPPTAGQLLFNWFAGNSNFQPIELTENPLYVELQKFNTMTLIYQNGRPIKYAKTPRGTIIMRTILKVLLPATTDWVVGLIQSPLFHHLRRRSADVCWGISPMTNRVTFSYSRFSTIAGFRLRMLFFFHSLAIRHNLVLCWMAFNGGRNGKNVTNTQKDIIHVKYLFRYQMTPARISKESG